MLSTEHQICLDKSLGASLLIGSFKKISVKDKFRLSLLEVLKNDV